VPFRLKTPTARSLKGDAKRKNDKHRAQWSSTLSNYAYPQFGDRSVAEVDQAAVLRVLDPIWPEKTETANRLRGRIEVILDWAKVRGYRDGENPARWKGHLDKALPARAKIQRVAHHAALPYNELPAFMNELVSIDTIGAKAFAFCILNATRTSETLLAETTEFDLEKKIWTIPPVRMKAGKEHRIPLTDASLEILAYVMKKKVFRSGFMFESSAREVERLSNMTFQMMLRRMGRDDLTGHGFRSTFRDWAAETTAYPREVAEAALAHAIGDKVEAAYRRGDLFEKRRGLMEDWARFALGSSDGEFEYSGSVDSAPSATLQMLGAQRDCRCDFIYPASNHFRGAWSYRPAGTVAGTRDQGICEAEESPACRQGWRGIGRNRLSP
jgi:integrase